jgi:hypothetical protein
LKIYHRTILLGLISSAFAHKIRRFFRRMAHKFGEFQLTSRANLAALNIGEIERRFFRQTPCAGNFSLGEKVW